jgi:hypothetical protein
MSSNPERLRHALKLIADNSRRCSVPMLLARGFDAELIAALLESGVAKAEVESAMVGGHARRVCWLCVTEAGTRLLMGRY